MADDTMEPDSSEKAPGDRRDDESPPADVAEEHSAATNGAEESLRDQAGEADEAPDSTHWATRVREFVDEATRIAREDLADKEVTFEDTTKRAEELIRKQPLAAVGLAAGVGLLAGILFNRRR